MLLLGILLLAIGLIWGLVSLLLAYGSEAPIVFSVAGLVLIGIGVADLMSVVRGWNRARNKMGAGTAQPLGPEPLQESNSQLVQRDRMTRAARRKGNNEFLDLGQRFGEIVAAVIVLLILAFYLYHQTSNTGFFTAKFGGWEMFAFYGPIILSLVPPIGRAVIGRRNPIRPYEAAGNIFFAFALLYLLIVFPFNFAHFSDALPTFLRFTLSWVTNDIAKVVLALAVAGGLISAGYNIVKYVMYHPTASSSQPRSAEEPLTLGANQA